MLHRADAFPLHLFIIALSISFGYIIWVTLRDILFRSGATLVDLGVAAIGISLLAGVWALLGHALARWQSELVESRNIIATRYAQKEHLEDNLRSTLKSLEAMHALVTRSQQEEKRQRVMLNTLLNNMPMAVFAKDARNNFDWLMINRKAEELFCVHHEDVVGNNDYKLFSKEEADFFHATDLRVMREGKLVEIEIEPVTTPKGTMLAHTFKAPIYDDEGEPAILLGILEDVTDLVKIQHDLRMPIREVMHSVSLLLKNPDITPTARQPLHAIEHAMAQMMDTLDRKWGK